MSEHRRMPETLKKHLIKVQGGKEYLPAAYRLVWFRDECPDWGIDTALVEGGQEAGFATVRAYVMSDTGKVVATGHKTETRQDFPAGWVEKAETGAIARALAIAGFGTQFTGDLDEGRFADAPLSHAGVPRAEETPAVRDIWEGPDQCPRCWAPEGKRHGYPCVRGPIKVEAEPKSDLERARARWFASCQEHGLIATENNDAYNRWLLGVVITAHFKESNPQFEAVKVSTRTKLPAEWFQIAADYIPKYLAHLEKTGKKPGEEFEG